MRRPISFKIAVLIPVVIASWIVTAGFTARYRVHAAANPSVPAIVKESVDPSEPVPAAVKDKHIHSTSWLTGHDFRVQGNEVEVSASVDLKSRSNDTAYLWRLKVSRKNDGVMEVDRFYVEQMFDMHPSGQMSPKFLETIQLPQGEHRVMITLLGVPKDYDLSKLSGHEKAFSMTKIQVARLVTIE